MKLYSLVTRPMPILMQCTTIRNQATMAWAIQSCKDTQSTENNNRKCDTPQLIVCTSDKVHGIKDVQVMGTSSKVKSPFGLTKVESKFTFKGIKNCEEEGCTVLDVTRKCSAEEFGNLFKKFLPHVRVNENNQLVSFKPNTSLQVLDIENATKNG